MVQWCLCPILFVLMPSRELPVIKRWWVFAAWTSLQWWICQIWHMMNSSKTETSVCILLVHVWCYWVCACGICNLYKIFMECREAKWDERWSIDHVSSDPLAVCAGMFLKCIELPFFCRCILIHLIPRGLIWTPYLVLIMEQRQHLPCCTSLT